MRPGSELARPDYLKVPFWRRGVAFGIDFVAAALVSSLLSGSIAAQAFVFAIAWLALRVIVTAQNHGQSLGRWALDMRVVDTKFYRGTPGLKELTKREAIAGLGALCTLIGLANLSLTAAWSLLLFLPVLADCGGAYLDRTQQRAVHDQVANTRIVEAQRGYSLDLKTKQLIAYMRKRMRK
ncbi:MAG TPA: RDD family protein [Elainellaceae cyanobacterium]